MCEQETHSDSDDVTLKQRTMRCGRAMKNIFIYEKVISLNERMARAGTKSHIWHNYSDIFELCFGIFLSFSLLSSLFFPSVFSFFSSVFYFFPSFYLICSFSITLLHSLFLHYCPSISIAFHLSPSLSITFHRFPSLSISLHPESHSYFSKNVYSR